MPDRVKLTEDELDQLRYAERNHSRTFMTKFPTDFHNAVIEGLTARGFFVDGGPSTFGRWRNLTTAGRALLASSGKGD